MPTETALALDSLRRDLERWRNSVDDAERERIKKRMIDTACEAIKDDTSHDQVMEIIGITTQTY